MVVVVVGVNDTLVYTKTELASCDRGAELGVLAVWCRKKEGRKQEDSCCCCWFPWLPGSS